MRSRNLALLGLILFVLVSCASAPSTGSAAASRTKAAEANDINRAGFPFVSSLEEIRAFDNFVAEPYRLGPGDVLRLQSVNNQIPEEVLQVSPDGFVTVRDIGEVAASRRDLTSVQVEINERLTKYYVNVEAKLVITQAVNNRVTLLGAVRSSGVILLEGNMTLVEVIAKAGGFDATPEELSSGLKRNRLLCRIIRDNGKTVWIDLKAILFQSADGANVRVKNNDILFVYKQ